MKKLYHLILTLFCSLLYCSMIEPTQVVSAQPRNTQSISVDISKTSLYIDSYEFGPAVSRIVLEFNADISQPDWSQTTIRTAGITRQISQGYLSDAKGNAISNWSSRYLTLELAVSYLSSDPAQNASPFTFNLSSYRNQWVSSYITSISNLTIQSVSTHQKQTIASQQESIHNRIIPSTERFANRGVSNNLQYAAYEPGSIAGGEKNPLIIWLHGVGEVGFDVNIPLLSSEVTSLSQDPIQQHFTSTGSGNQHGAYVLVAQSPYAWGNWQSASLKTLIDNYVSSHPDIDSSRIYLAGASNGGTMTVTMGVTYPNYFAALIPISAQYPYQYSYDASKDLFTYTVTDATYNALAHQPMWLIHTRADTTIPVDDSVLPFYKAVIDRNASNKWLSYYETATGSDLAGSLYDGHWSWIYFFNDQITGVQSIDNTKNKPALWGMVATDPTHGGASRAIVNGTQYNNIFDWLNAQKR